MARAGLGSRRANEQLIAAGRVRINGRVARLGDKADPQSDRIEVDGQPVDFSIQQQIYIKLNKPRGVISSLEDEMGEDRPIVRDLIPAAGHIYPVGRLDKQSEGLMLMTNDGQIAHRLGQQLQALYFESLETVGAGPRLERAAAQDVRAGALDHASRLQRGLLLLDRARPGDDREAASDQDARGVHHGRRRVEEKTKTKKAEVAYIHLTMMNPSNLQKFQQAVAGWMKSKKTKGIIARGDPRHLRDESDDVRVRAFFNREAQAS